MKATSPTPSRNRSQRRQSALDRGALQRAPVRSYGVPRNPYRLALGLVGALCALSALPVRAQSIETVAPVVVKTVPEAGSEGVAPGIVEIKVTFSKKMTDGSWSWSDAWKDSTPETIGKPHYEADRKTCVIKVKLEPNKTYGYWLNSQRFTNFRDTGGRAAVPYLLAFKTKEK